ncbi:hypothetical protein [Photobacterium atrarenae]|uniref:C-type lysozyme inhibitor domain-containing protein n=1 Tax=Photobacterium atrarenae TaxID=865757 RepID=A0ABY5GLB3_9GAMM|nr:hypothetical protein [Photobacterium atrarenae]UTV29083.1 hypothetical protein NNL38_07605 [Photobacterium atrarenae]
MKRLILLSTIVAALPASAATFSPLMIRCEFRQDDIQLVVTNTSAQYTQVKLTSSRHNVMVTGSSGQSSSTMTLSRSQFPVTLETAPDNQISIDRDCQIEPLNAS